MATGFSVADAVPAAITGVTAACAVTGTGTCGTNGSSGNSVQFTNLTLAPGAGNALTFTISGTVSADETGSLINTGFVTPGVGSTDTNAANNSATDADTAGTAQVDLVITKTDGQASYVPGRPLTYVITVTNAGPSTASGVSIADTVPAAITGVVVSCTPGGTALCGANGSSGNNVSFTGATVPPGGANALTLTVTGTVDPAATGTLTNTAMWTAGAGSTDTNPANNSATDADTLGAAQVDLAITKTDGQASYVPGAPITYTITVTNAGPSAATGFSVSDLAPPGLTVGTTSCAVVGLGSCGTNATAGNTVSFTGASLAPGVVNALTITVTGTIDPNTTGPLANTATVTAGANASDTNPANNTATDTDTQGAGLADLAITKTDAQAGYVAGTPVSYTL